MSLRYRFFSLKAVLINKISFRVARWCTSYRCFLTAPGSLSHVFLSHAVHCKQRCSACIKAHSTTAHASLLSCHMCFVLVYVLPPFSYCHRLSPSCFPITLTCFQFGAWLDVYFKPCLSLFSGKNCSMPAITKPFILCVVMFHVAISSVLTVVYCARSSSRIWFNSYFGFICLLYKA